MNTPLRLLLLSATAAVAACQSTVELPSNVVKTASAPNQPTYIERIDFSYKTNAQVAFPKARLCIAENIQNQSVQLRDSSRSFVGPATGTLYRTENSQNIGGGDIFKFSDESLRTLIATGTTITTGSSIVRDIVRFDLKLALQGDGITLQFQNITRAQQDTGVAANTGFGPVGTWAGARAPDIYSALEAVANKVKSCLQ